MTAAKQKILIVDDAEAVHAVVKARLRDDNLEFFSAYTGQSALDTACSLLPDVILLDVSIPAPDGFEVCRRLKAHPHTEIIPIIFFTASTLPEHQADAMDMGAWDYITKPFDAGALRARVRAALRTKRLLDALDHQRMIDGLTGLWNRTYFDHRLVTELALSNRHNRPLSCVMLDVDHFKAINDCHGHLAGDEVLRGLAKLLLRECRTEDIVCRYGGEEFVILAPNTPAPRAVVLAERLRAAAAAEPFGTAGSDGSLQLRLTCSFGVADARVLHQSSLIDLADRALYHAKQTGRNRVVCTAASDCRAGAEMIEVGEEGPLPQGTEPDRAGPVRAAGPNHRFPGIKTGSRRERVDPDLRSGPGRHTPAP